jgi:hypothetical protein
MSKMSDDSKSGSNLPPYIPEESCLCNQILSTSESLHESPTEL